MGVVWDGWLCLGTRYFPTLGSVGSTNHGIIVNIVILAESDDNGNYDHECMQCRVCDILPMEVKSGRKTTATAVACACFDDKTR